MKNIKFPLIALLLLGAAAGAEAQVISNKPVFNGIQDENAFLDASTNFGDGNSVGKGLVFPATDLTNWQFKTSGLDGILFPTYLDGMIVYNTATGTTLSGQGNQVAVTPGYYYFSNPNGANNGSINAGEWKKLDGSTSGEAISVKNAAYAMASTDKTLLFDLSAPATLTLPTAAAANGRVYVIRKIDDTDNVLTFTQPITIASGVTVTTLNLPTTLTIQSDGTNWYALN